MKLYNYISDRRKDKKKGKLSPELEELLLSKTALAETGLK
jgi:hypothetical protein